MQSNNCPFILVNHSHLFLDLLVYVCVRTGWIVALSLSLAHTGPAAENFDCVVTMMQD